MYCLRTVSAKALILQPQTRQLCANIARSLNGLLEELLSAERKSFDGWYSQALAGLRTSCMEVRVLVHLFKGLQDYPEAYDTRVEAAPHNAHQVTGSVPATHP
jgi:hypothetical protein